MCPAVSRGSHLKHEMHDDEEKRILVAIRVQISTFELLQVKSCKLLNLDGTSSAADLSYTQICEMRRERENEAVSAFASSV